MVSIRTAAVFLALPFLVAAQCDLCPDGSDVLNGDSIVPSFNLGVNTNPTCSLLESYIRQTIDSTDCELIQAQAGFCGCPGVEPVNACSLCDGGASPGVPDRLTFVGDTCSDVDSYMSYLSAEGCQSEVGLFLQSHAALCECPGVEPACTLCADGGEVVDREQQVTDGTCGALEDLILRFTDGQCVEFERAVIANGIRCGCREEDFPQCTITNNAEFCTHALLETATEECECNNFCDGAFIGCSDISGENVQSCDGFLVSGCNKALPCYICSDKSNVVNGDRVVPFFNLGDELQDPTCSELESFVQENPRDNFFCQNFEAQAGFCGCPDLEPVNACSLCDGGASPGVPDKITFKGDTCADIDVYVSFLSSADCASTRAESMLAYAALCECPGAIPACSLCAETREVADPDKEVPDGKCGQIDDLIKTSVASDCVENDRLIKLNGVRCGCRDRSEFPACSIQQNNEFCSPSLLETATEWCECYNFCDGIFIGCSDFPGEFISNCNGIVVSGCNAASATEPEDDSSSTSLLVNYQLMMYLVFAGSVLFLG